MLQIDVRYVFLEQGGEIIVVECAGLVYDAA
jgi:hypothetical protein